jgi:HNH endonuclease/Helix-turn-helix domain of resolvase/NUMOD4 motif
MEKSMPGERWKNVEFNFDYASENRIEVSNFGRVRSFNRLSEGNILEGSMINGYKIIRLKFFAERDEAAERKFIYHNKQIAKFTVKVRQMKLNRESKTAIKEATVLLDGLRMNQKKKLAADWKSRATNYHSLVHKLVADYFLKKPSENHTIVAHLDYDKLNNRASNLKWMTHEENVIHQRSSPHVLAEKEKRRGGSGRTSRTTKLSLTKVMLLKKLLNEGKPVKSLVKQFKVSDMQIYRIKNGENWGDVPAAK